MEYIDFNFNRDVQRDATRGRIQARVTTKRLSSTMAL